MRVFLSGAWLARSTQTPRFIRVWASSASLDLIGILFRSESERADVQAVGTCDLRVIVVLNRYLPSVVLYACKTPSAYISNRTDRDRSNSGLPHGEWLPAARRLVLSVGFRDPPPGLCSGCPVTFAATPSLEHWIGWTIYDGPNVRYLFII